MRVGVRKATRRTTTMIEEDGGGGNAGVRKQKWAEAQEVGVAAFLPGSTSTTGGFHPILGPQLSSTEDGICVETIKCEMHDKRMYNSRISTDYMNHDWIRRQRAICKAYARKDHRSTL
jgi:hypothetical protein